MNEAMAQLLAGRLNLTPEEVQAVQAGDPSAIVARRVRDPALAAAITSMLRPPAESETAPTGPSAEERLDEARREVGRLRQELAAADAMVKYIADVFGACPACWGRVAECERCKGRGKPGSRVPLEEELLAWVGPALRRLHMRVVRASS